MLHGWWSRLNCSGSRYSGWWCYCSGQCIDNLPQHGGARAYWAAQFGIAVEEMVDLSTGINPNGWPVPAVPTAVWQRLPEVPPPLMEAATQYYGSDALLAVAGSQAAIQLLPQLRLHSRVGVLTPMYCEHQQAWEVAGHAVTALEASEIEAQLPQLDVLVVANPNNPTGTSFSASQLLHWHQQLSERGGWLVVDEAFIDASSVQSLAHQGEPRTGLIVLRSIGKFFGLAGIRVGFVSATPSLLEQMQKRLGPWTVSHPAQWVAAEALKDQDWQQHAREQLRQNSDRLQQLLGAQGLPPTGGTILFQWVETAYAAMLFKQLAEQGILVRYFETPQSLRFGLPVDELEWAKLQRALSQCAIRKGVA